MLFSFNKFQEEIVALVNVSSGYVEGALVHVSKTGNPEIVFGRKISLSLSESVTPEKIQVGMLKGVEEVVKILGHEGRERLAILKLNHTVKHLYCVFSSPWYISQTKVIKIDRDDPIMITSDLIEKLVKEERTIFKESLHKGDYSKNFKDTVEIVESKIVRIKLNGYETGKPEGKRAKKIEIALYLSIAGAHILHQIKDAIRKNFNFRSITFHSFPLAFFSVLRDLPETPQDFLFVDAREEVTDISLVKKGLFLETITIPLGSHFFIREIANSLNTLPQVAFSFLRLYTENKAEPAVAEKIKNILNSKQEWTLHFNESLKNFCEEFFLPKTIYLAADSDFTGLFSEMIRKNIFEQLPSDKEPFVVVPVLSALLKDYYTTNLPDIDFSLMQLESVFINKMMQS